MEKTKVEIDNKRITKIMGKALQKIMKWTIRNYIGAELKLEITFESGAIEEITVFINNYHGE